MKMKLWAGRLRRSVALGALLSATGTVALAAEQPPADTVEKVKPPEEAPENRLRRSDRDRISIVQDSYSSASAMTVVTADEGRIQGITDIATLLQNSVAASGSSQTTAAISSALAAPPGGLGTQTIQLRGLGANRTLVLMNGRRAGPAGTGGSVGPFDLNVVPLSAVERVEILKDGASSLYGSDAVAGVINIITKTDSSSSFDISYTYPEIGAGEELSVSGTWGQAFDNGYFRISADYYHQQEFDRGDQRHLLLRTELLLLPARRLARRFLRSLTNDYTCRDDVIWGHNWTLRLRREFRRAMLTGSSPSLAEHDRSLSVRLFGQARAVSPATSLIPTPRRQVWSTLQAGIRSAIPTSSPAASPIRSSILTPTTRRRLKTSITRS